jgi:bifunctional non-homologous end joining protein LigD
MATESTTQTVTVDGHPIKLSNLDKVLYPETGTTKADVLAYYAAVAPVLLPHLYERPATRKRWPDGVGTPEKPGMVFFHKDLAKGTPDWVRRHKIVHRDHDNYYPVVDDLATLTWLAQLASLEIHVPQWRFGPDGEPRNPDRLVLDLDPGPGVDLAQCAEVARWAREILTDIGHAPVPVTSGSKGIHLYAPLDGSQTPEQATAVARELARALEAEHPELVISIMRRADRDGKVFLDWSQNNGNKTTISPYSMRGRMQPTVAAPRTWAELDDPGLRQLRYDEVMARLEQGDDPLAALGVQDVPSSSGGAGDGPRSGPAQGGPPAPDPSQADAGGTADRLATYRSMRDAARTPEPVPAAAPVDREGQSFVIQEHHARALHYDFRLEHDGVLVSWAVPKGPPTDTTTNRLAVQTEDHPLEYGSFEGRIPRGEYGGGNVSIWDSGSYRLHKWRDGREVIATLFGRPDGGLGGVAKFALIHTGHGSGGKAAQNWLMHRMETDPEDLPGGTETSTPPTAATSAPEPASTPPEPVAPTPPEPVAPMLATLTTEDEFGEEEGWAFEMKWDGVRIIASVSARAVLLQSRKGRDETQAYPDIVEALRSWLDRSPTRVESAVLDGEVVVVDAGGRPRFGLLQNRINLTRPADIAQAAKAFPAQLMLFDLLQLNGRDLTRETYDERRRLLDELTPDEPGLRVQVPPIFDGDLHAAMDTSRLLDLEGVVAKRRTSSYQPGRRGGSWLKIKHQHVQEVVIGGWRPGNGRREGGVGSLLLGVNEGDELRYVGRVGSGFNDHQLDEIQARLARLARATSPLADVPREDARDAHWVTPSLVGEVKYGELTSAGRLRHPVWRGWREDKDPAEVVLETPTAVVPPS